MSKDSKRYRQLSIAESFCNSKKSRTTPSMEQNLRDLLAAAAEKRITSTNSSPMEISDKISAPKCDLQQASTSYEICEEENSEAQNSEEFFAPSSQELFPDSEELFDTQSTIEIPPTPEAYLKSKNTSLVSTLFADISLDKTDSGSQSMLENETDSLDENIQVSFLNRIPKCSVPLPKLEPLENHFILFSPHVREKDAPRPYPSTYRDKWDCDHVRMPCSSHNKYPVEDINGRKHIVSRWDLICKILRGNIETSKELEDAILEYNFQYKERWKFGGLHGFFEQYLPEDESVYFFESVLPKMIKMALELPSICTQPPSLLKKNKDFKITLSQKQIGCLLLNAFFCTFPCRNNYSSYRKYKTSCEYATYPDINFNRLFFGVKNRISSSTAEKIKCLINYFRRITTKEPTGTVTFHRQCLQNLPDWNDSVKGMKIAIVKSTGLIETEGHGMLQVDFANKFVGGGVLGQGCVQEEIRFAICPELIVSRLFVESLNPNEVLIITGVEQYSSYSGYSNTFKWEGNYIDKTERDAWGRKCTQLVAMDATSFRNTCEQYKPFRIERELNKAFCGFYEDAYPLNLSAVATGNWGCGAFKGNPILKFIIQLMAASQTGRDMLYFTFGNKSLMIKLQKLYTFFTEKNITVGDLWRILMKYFDIAKVRNDELNPTLYEFICSIFEDDNDSEEAISVNTETTEIVDSDQLALEYLIRDVERNSNSETEDKINIVNKDPG